MGNTRPGIVTASFGTSGTIYACADAPVIDPEGEMAAFCDFDRIAGCRCLHG